MNATAIHQAYAEARERYAELGVDAEQAISELDHLAISLDAGMADRPPTDQLSSYDDALRRDFMQARRQLPGQVRLTLHAAISSPSAEAEPLPAADDETRYDVWMQWSREEQVPLDLHVATGPGLLTLSSSDMSVRKPWVARLLHYQDVADAIGENQKKPCILSFEIADQLGQPALNLVIHRQMLTKSLDQLLSERRCWMRSCLMVPSSSAPDSTFVASHEQLVSYAMQHPVMLGLRADTGPSALSTMADTVASLPASVASLSLILPNPCDRPVASHAQLNDEGVNLFRQLLCTGRHYRTHLTMSCRPCADDRVSAIVTGIRDAQQSMLRALLEPIQRMQDLELSGDERSKALLLDNARSLPWPAVYDEFCNRKI